MQSIIGRLISHTQSAFLPGRGSSGNILIAQEVLHYFKQKKGRKCHMMIKIDLEKAYDRVDWNFLEQILMKIRMPQDVISLIMNSLRSSQMAILWNGNKLPSIRPSRGLRQGDPLAPYLFDLCMEVLSQYITQSVNNEEWKPIQIGKHCPPLTHIFFADDLILFGEASVKQARIMKNVLDIFCGYSCEKISFAKSRFHLSNNAPNQLKRQISESLGMHHIDDFGTYLGVPLLQGRIKISHYSFILDKMRKKLSSWKARCLSKAGKAILIQSSLSTHPYYIMQTTRLPIGCTQAMEKICRAFFWGEDDGTRKMHYISWDIICQPKSCGGLGFKRLYEMNIAMIGKLVWQLLTDDNALWVRVLGLKYGSPFLQPKPTASASWKGICMAARSLSTHFDIRDNEIIWKGNNVHKYTVAEAYSMITNDIFSDDNRFWNVLWKLKGPHRFNYFLWQTAHNCLPTLELLNKRQVCDTNICQLCHQAPETHLHALRDCGFATHLWTKAIPLSRRHEFFAAPGIHSWIVDNLCLDTPHSNWAYTFRDLLYSLWRRRNKLYHEPETDFPPLTILLSQSVKRVKNLRLAWDIHDF